MNDESSIVKANYSQLPREAKKTNDSTFDRIYKYYHNNKTRVELSAVETAIRERWEKAWLLLCRHRTRKQVVELISKLYNVSASVAYDDVRHAMMLFTDPQEDTRPAKRAIAEDALLKGADKAWKSGNLELHLKYLKEYTELNRLKEGDPATDMGELMKKLKPHNIIIVAKPDELQAEAERLQRDIIQDIEHEELDEESEAD